MAITSIIVLYVVIWALVFFVLNPFGQVSQSESGKVEPGTPASAPVDAMIRRKMIMATIVGTVIFAVVLTVLLKGWVTLDDISFVKLPSER